VMLAFGAALGGLVSGVFGIHTAFVVDAATFLISAFFISRIDNSRVPPTTSERSLRLAVYEYFEGLRYLIHRPGILLIALHKAVLGLLLGASYDIVQIAISEQVFVIGIGGGLGLGLMYGISGVGAGLGPILLRRFTGDDDGRLRKALMVAYLCGGVGLLVIAPLHSFESVLAGNLLRGFGGGILWVFSTQLLLQSVPGKIRGRVFATELAIFTLMSGLGSATVGGLLDTPLGIAGVTKLMASLCLVPTLLWGLWIRKGPVERERSSPG